MQMSRLQMETGQIWELMVIRQRHQIYFRWKYGSVDPSNPEQRCKHTGTEVRNQKRQPVQQQAIREILTVRPVKKTFHRKEYCSKRSQHHNKDTESNCKQGWKDYNHMYTVWDNDQNGKDCQGIKDKIIKDKIYL